MSGWWSWPQGANYTSLQRVVREEGQVILLNDNSTTSVTLGVSTWASFETFGFSDLWQNFNYSGRISTAVTSVAVRNAPSSGAVRSAPWVSRRTVMAVSSASAEVSARACPFPRNQEKDSLSVKPFHWSLSALTTPSLSRGPSLATPWTVAPTAHPTWF